MTNYSKTSRLPLTSRLAAAAKKALPSFLHAPARALLRGLFSIRRSFGEVGLWLSLWWHKRRGGKYIDWYAKKVDSSAKPAAFIMEQMPEWIYESGADDLKAAQRLGLKPEHTMHEFGCGFLRSGNHFIRYLNKGNYSGNDAAGVRISRALEIFTDLIREKGARLYTNSDNSLSWVGRKVDYVWSHAVFGHMPEEDIAETIGNMKKIMHEKSVVLFSYDPPPSGHADDLVYREDSRDWCHSLRFFEQLASRHGMSVEDVSWAVRDLPTWRARINLARMTIIPRAAERS